MADVIALDVKIQQAEEKRRARARKRKLDAVRNVLQCSRCALKCEKCGTYLSDDGAQALLKERSHKIPYRFCEGCTLEYKDYIQRLQGGGDPDCYWHNQAWLDSWRTWIDFRASVDRYLHSKEFTRLLKELREE